MKLNFRERYFNDIVPALMKSRGYSNVQKVPKINKICINRGCGEASKKPKELSSTFSELALITGQKPKRNTSKKSIAGFKIREGMDVGASVTLRKKRMYAFLEKLVYIILPRIRDFKGLYSTAFDGKGNITLGVTSQLIFPEIQYENVTQQDGLSISIVTSASTDEEGYALLQQFGLPFVTSAET